MLSVKTKMVEINPIVALNSTEFVLFLGFIFISKDYGLVFTRLSTKRHPNQTNVRFVTLAGAQNFFQSFTMSSNTRIGR